MADLNRIKVILAEKKVSNKSLAEHLDKREETISRWCQNKQQPSIEDLNKIAEFLIIDIRSLLNPSDWSK
ncbi:helix-turn-helix transcriptional regulator [Pedobacter sp. Leaf170]|uniref:helix-turn-helix transcriptional regulator n=1 Tax=Pedobacter sp. Leaf170 TaxID=2876558 RepID=UPI001E291B98|nr:helix-turn-helix transcriptional regulator [Pedobacter sp. Leaf170]